MKKILLSLIPLLGFSIYIEARPSPVDNKAALGMNQATFRNLIADCLERSDANACHQAGIYMLTYRNDQKKAISYLKNACELGKGTSCKYLGDMYAKNYHKVSMEYYEIGCLRKSKSACRLAKKKRK